MNSKSLKEALETAQQEAAKDKPAGGGAWDSGDYTVEILSASVNAQFGAPRIGFQVQRQDDGRRRFFDLYFDEDKPKALHMTGLKLKGLGLSEVIDKADTLYPGDTTAQLEMIASAMRGIVFVAEVQKIESNKNTPTTPEDEKQYVNYFQVKELIAGPSTTPQIGDSAPANPAGGLGGLMG